MYCLPPAPQVSEDVRALLTEQFNQSHGRLDAAILTALGDLMVGGHPNVFQPSLDFLADVVKGTAGQAVDSAGGVAADGASVRRTSDSPSLAVLLANRRTAYVVLDHVSAAFKARGLLGTFGNHARWLTRRAGSWGARAIVSAPARPRARGATWRL